MDIQEVELGDETEGDGLTADSRPDKSQENPPNTVNQYFFKKLWGHGVINVVVVVVEKIMCTMKYFFHI